MSAKITVCIPTYNRAHFLGEAIQSVLNQTFSNFVLTISDNASTDKTAEVVSRFTDSRIQYYRQATNIGLAANHRWVAEQANTELVAILSDDDLYLPEHLEAALTQLEAYPASAYYTCALQRFGNGPPGVWRPAAITDSTTPVIYFTPRQAANFLGLENPGFLNTLVCWKDRLNGTLFWGKPGFVHADVLILTQLMIQGGCLFSNRPTVRYRFHDANVSRPTRDPIAARRLHFMLRYAVRYLAQLLLDTATCEPADIEAHGLSTTSQCAALVVLSLGSFQSSPTLQTLARRIFRARRDIDEISFTCRRARQAGFWMIPLLEQVDFLRLGWRP